MPPTRPRRIVRRAAMALAVFLLLPVLYITTAVSLSFAWGAGWLPQSLVDVLQVVYWPVGAYAEAGYPGGVTIIEIIDAAIAAGERLGN
jgi:hypothetical protein